MPITYLDAVTGVTHDLIFGLDERDREITWFACGMTIPLDTASVLAETRPGDAVTCLWCAAERRR